MIKILVGILSGFILVNSAIADKLVIVNKGADNVTLLDIESGDMSNVTVGNMPHEVAVSSENAYVANFGINHIRSFRLSDKAGSTISVVNLETAEEVTQIDLGSPPCAPHGIVYSENSNTVYVTCEARYELTAIDAQTNEIKYSVATTQPGSHMLVVDSEDKFAYIANFWIGTISVIDLNERKLVNQIRVEQTVEGIAIDADNAFLYTTNVVTNPSRKKSLQKINLETFEIELNIEIPGDTSPIRVHIPNNSSKLFINMARTGEVGVYSAEDLTLEKMIEVGTQPIGITSSTDGQFVYVANMRDNTVSVIDTNLLEVTETLDTGLDLPDGMAYGAAAD